MKIHVKLTFGLCLLAASACGRDDEIRNLRSQAIEENALGLASLQPSPAVSANLCNGGRLLAGDVNGDTYHDLVCLGDGTVSVFLSSAAAITTTTPSWSGPLPAGTCAASGDLILGDVDGNGKSDLICHGASGAVAVIYGSASGAFLTATPWVKNDLGFCGNGEIFKAGDINGDGKTDLVCHASNGAAWVLYRDAATTYSWASSWYDLNLQFCVGDADFLVTDLDGNKKSDLVCHSPTGSVWALYADDANRFGWSKSFAAPTLSFCARPGVFGVAKINGYGRSDLHCHDPGMGRDWFLYTDEAGRPSWDGAWFDADRRFCAAPGVQVAGDFNGDRRDDLYCDAGSGGFALTSEARPAIGAATTTLFDWYQGFTAVETTDGPMRSNGSHTLGPKLARKAMADAAQHDVRDIRFFATPFFVHQFVEYAPGTPSSPYWSSMDRLMDDLAAHHLKGIPNFLWSPKLFVDRVNLEAGVHEDLNTFVTNPSSKAFGLYLGLMKEFATRYRYHPAMHFYDITGELNLQADVVNNDPMLPGVFTSAQLLDFTRRVAKMLRSVDPFHPISSGFSIPRASAEAFRARPLWDAYWAANAIPRDDMGQLATNLTYLHQYMDIMSVHIYNYVDEGDFYHSDAPVVGVRANQDRFKPNASGALVAKQNGDTFDFSDVSLFKTVSEIAAAAGKRLYVGEYGDNYMFLRNDRKSAYVHNAIDAIVQYRIPYSSIWVLESYSDAPWLTYNNAATNSNIEPGYTDEILRKLQAAGRALGAANPLSAVTTTPPRLVISWPIEGSQSTLDQCVHAQASSSGGTITRVELRVSGGLRETLTAPPYQFSLASLPLNTTSVTLVAFDAAGRSTSQEVKIELVSTASAPRVTGMVLNGTKAPFAGVDTAWPPKRQGCMNLSWQARFADYGLAGYEEGRFGEWVRDDSGAWHNYAAFGTPLLDEVTKVDATHAFGLSKAYRRAIYLEKVGGKWDYTHLGGPMITNLEAAGPGTLFALDAATKTLVQWQLTSTGWKLYQFGGAALTQISVVAWNMIFGIQQANGNLAEWVHDGTQWQFYPFPAPALTAIEKTAWNNVYGIRADNGLVAQWVHDGAAWRQYDFPHASVDALSTASNGELYGIDRWTSGLVQWRYGSGGWTFQNVGIPPTGDGLEGLQSPTGGPTFATGRAGGQLWSWSNGSGWSSAGFGFPLQRRIEAVSGTQVLGLSRAGW